MSIPDVYRAENQGWVGQDSLYYAGYAAAQVQLARQPALLYRLQSK